MEACSEALTDDCRSSSFDEASIDCETLSMDEDTLSMLCSWLFSIFDSDRALCSAAIPIDFVIVLYIVFGDCYEGS